MRVSNNNYIHSNNPYVPLFEVNVARGDAYNASIEAQNYSPLQPAPQKNGHEYGKMNSRF